VLAVEPNIDELPGRLAELDIRLVSQREALATADVVVGLVDHSPFKRIGSAELAEKVVIDTRGVWR